MECGAWGFMMFRRFTSQEGLLGLRRLGFWVQAWYISPAPARKVRVFLKCNGPFDSRTRPERLGFRIQGFGNKNYQDNHKTCEGLRHTGVRTTVPPNIAAISMVSKPRKAIVAQIARLNLSAGRLPLRRHRTLRAWHAVPSQNAMFGRRLFVPVRLNRRQGSISRAASHGVWL